jgi:hypothetical protein
MVFVTTIRLGVPQLVPALTILKMIKVLPLPAGIFAAKILFLSAHN